MSAVTGHAAADPSALEWTVEHVELEDPRAVTLRDAMSAELGARYADRIELRRTRQASDNPAGTILPDSVIATILILGAQGQPAGHGILRWLEDEPEIKRVYVAPEARGQGAAAALMEALEQSAAATGLPRVRLSTGDRQPDAVKLYRKLGYRRIPLFGPYVDYPWSICFEKRLSPSSARREARRSAAYPRHGE